MGLSLYTLILKVSYPVYKESLKVNMPPTGLAIIIGAGPNTGTGIARILSHPKHGNLAVALLARRQEGLNSVRSNLKQTSPGSVVETFPTDTSPNNLKQAFQAIKSHASFKDLKLKVAVYSVKHSSKKPFMNETYEEFTESLEQYVGGAFTFSQEALKMFFEHHGEAPLSETGEKKGTLIFLPRRLWRDWFSGSKTSYLPFVLACHMSKTALGMPLLVSASLITPWKRVSSPSEGMSWTTLAPRSRKGVSGDQKGPRMAEEVGSRPCSVTILWLISSTRDSTPNTSHTLQASFRFFLYAWPIELT